MSRGIRAHNCRDLPPFKLFLFSHFTAAAAAGWTLFWPLWHLNKHIMLLDKYCAVPLRTKAMGNRNGYNPTMTMTTSTMASSTSTALDHKVMLINMRSWPSPSFHLGLSLFFWQQATVNCEYLFACSRLFMPVASAGSSQVPQSSSCNTKKTHASAAKMKAT